MGQTTQFFTRHVSTIPGSLILAVVAAAGILTIGAHLPDEPLQPTPLVLRQAAPLAVSASAVPSGPPQLQ